jgi:hypothetical protein
MYNRDFSSYSSNFAFYGYAKFPTAFPPLKEAIEQEGYEDLRVMEQSSLFRAPFQRDFKS